ncbi:MAG: hypothetical protein IJW92_09600 [Clostridia bacterium]|nr:hypothetical protein [Clostridia bacterium]
MGCLMEFLLEVLLEGVIEGLFYLMQLIIPKRHFGETTRKVLTVVVGVFTAFLLITVFFGFFAWISEDPYTSYIGRFMVLIPLGLIFVQVGLGILFRYLAEKKK